MQTQILESFKAGVFAKRVDASMISDRQPGRQTDGSTGRQTDKQPGRQMKRRAGKWTTWADVNEGWTDRRTFLKLVKPTT